LFVGDREGDAQAAAAVGMRFVYADRFFGRSRE
jgi:phosphoglycolate phosphatase-like HAD superfamily hydrolase